jgi:nitrile hydratase
MNGVHDMGGMQGFGPITVEPGEPAYHADWERHVNALMRRTVNRVYNLDQFRNAIEHIPPSNYLAMSYYERWLTAVEQLVQQAETTRPPEDMPETRSGPPRFKVGDSVVTRVVHPAGHTRLPRYARGKRGMVALVKGPYLLPDTNAHLVSRDWQPVYAVRFDARELWGETAEPHSSVCVDVWESYLEEDRNR